MLDRPDRGGRITEDPGGKNGPSRGARPIDAKTIGQVDAGRLGTGKAKLR
jgi:hypothetical protein